MGYRDYAKDYQIRYEETQGKAHPRSVRVYVGPYFRFKAEQAKIRKLRWFYTIGLAACAVFLLIPMCIDCTFTRTWFIQVPAAAAWIPWVLATASTWRLWTAGEKVNREHRDLIHDRMSGACLFLMGFCLISVFGCVRMMGTFSPTLSDYLVCGCCVGSELSAIALFSRRGELEMVPVAQPEESK